MKLEETIVLYKKDYDKLIYKIEKLEKALKDIVTGLKEHGPRVIASKALEEE